MTGIYKITNKINNKSYIGQSIHIERRFYEHQHESYWDDNKILYQAFRKYGLENFTFEVIEECAPEDLNIKEQYWINFYHSYPDGYNMTSGGETNYGENHPKHKLTEIDIKDIRTRYTKKERKKEVYQLYKDRIGESGFSKIWKGETWKTIMPEVYTKENKEFHLHDTANKGSSNGRAKLTEAEVRDIRIRRKLGESCSSVYALYQDKLTKGSFENVWFYQNWKNIIV